MGLNSKRAEFEDGLPSPQAKKSCLGDLDANPASHLSDQNLWSGARFHPESAGSLNLTPAKRVLNAEYPTQVRASSSFDHADSEESRVVLRNLTPIKRLFDACYPVQVGVLSSLDRTDFRNMQLAGLGLRISRVVQRLHLIPISCSNNGALRPKKPDQIMRLDFLARVGWLPEISCDNTTATMDEIKPCSGMIWPMNFCPETADDIDSCRVPHFDVTGYEVNVSSHNVCLECVEMAKRRMLAIEHHKISRLRRTLCSKHTMENTPQAQNEPCECLMILGREWRCWGCRRSTLRGLTGIAMKRKKALDEGRYDKDDDDHDGGDGGDGANIDHGDNIKHGDGDEEDQDDQNDSSSDDDGEKSDSNDSEDRDMRDDRIPRDRAHFCPISGCPEWITSQEQELAKRSGEGLKMCLACQLILLPSAEEEEQDDDDDEEEEEEEEEESTNLS